MKVIIPKSINGIDTDAHAKAVVMSVADIVSQGRFNDQFDYIILADEKEIALNTFCLSLFPELTNQLPVSYYYQSGTFDERILHLLAADTPAGVSVGASVDRLKLDFANYPVLQRPPTVVEHPDVNDCFKVGDFHAGNWGAFEDDGVYFEWYFPNRGYVVHSDLEAIVAAKIPAQYSSLYSHNHLEGQIFQGPAPMINFRHVSNNVFDLIFFLRNFEGTEFYLMSVRCNDSAAADVAANWSEAVLLDKFVMKKNQVIIGFSQLCLHDYSLVLFYDTAGVVSYELLGQRPLGIEKALRTMIENWKINKTACWTFSEFPQLDAAGNPARIEAYAINPAIAVYYYPDFEGQVEPIGTPQPGKGMPTGYILTKGYLHPVCNAWFYGTDVSSGYGRRSYMVAYALSDSIAHYQVSQVNPFTGEIAPILAEGSRLSNNPLVGSGQIVPFYQDGVLDPAQRYLAFASRIANYLYVDENHEMKYLTFIDNTNLRVGGTAFSSSISVEFTPAYLPPFETDEVYRRDIDEEGLVVWKCGDYGFSIDPAYSNNAWVRTPEVCVVKSSGALKPCQVAPDLNEIELSAVVFRLNQMIINGTADQARIDYDSTAESVTVTFPDSRVMAISGLSPNQPSILGVK